MRYITKITSANPSSCKEIMKITDEFCHLEGVKPNFIVSEGEYLLTSLGLNLYDDKSKQ